MPTSIAKNLPVGAWNGQHLTWISLILPFIEQQERYDMMSTVWCTRGAAKNGNGDACGVPHMGEQAFFSAYYEPNTNQANEISSFWGARQCHPSTKCPCVPVTTTLYNAANARGSRLSARSNHSGGVNAAFGDGSVHFIPNTVNRTVWRALSDAADGEADRCLNRQQFIVAAC